MKTIKGEELKGRDLEVLEDGTLRLIENKPKKFIPNTCEEYWYIHNLGSIESTLNDDSCEDFWLIRHQMVFKTKEECEEYRSFLDLLDEYKFEPDWNNAKQDKYYLFYDHQDAKIAISSYRFTQSQNVFHFKLKTDAQEFIEKVGEGNIKRFMFDVWE